MGIDEARSDKVARYAQFSLCGIARWWRAAQPFDRALVDAQAPRPANGLLWVGGQEDGITQQ